MPKKNEVRVVIDTNIWISFLIGKKLSSLANLLVERKVILAVCDQLLQEILIVTSRPKLSKYFPSNKVADLLKLLSTIGESYVLTTTIDVCRDAKDNFLLVLCDSSKADYLITGDNDLLILDNYKKQNHSA